MKVKSSILLFAIVSSLTVAVSAQNVQPVNSEGLAIGGYDVVSYFSNNATKGIDIYSAKYEGVTYHFSTQENRDAFKAEPTKYIPQFGGYCAWGVAARDSKFPVNPETFDIVDGKLYLFFNGSFNNERLNTISFWNAETTKLQAEAHQKWPSVKNK